MESSHRRYKLVSFTIYALAFVIAMVAMIAAVGLAALMWYYPLETIGLLILMSASYSGHYYRQHMIGAKDKTEVSHVRN